jgi:hypothetical protein
MKTSRWTQQGLKERGLRNRQGSSRRRAKCPSRHNLSGSRKCDGGVGEGILDGDSGEDAAGEILLPVGMQMCHRSVRVENESWSWSTVARARACGMLEIDGGGGTHTDGRRWRRDPGHSCSPARWRRKDVLLFSFFVCRYKTLEHLR